MDYYSYYNLRFDPFIKNSLIGQQLFRSKDHDKAHNEMNQAVEKNGVCVITGKTGYGKSQAVHAFISGLESAKHACISVQPGELSPTDFYKLVCAKMRIDPTGKLGFVRKNVKRHVWDYYNRGRPLVLVINEAQDLSLKTLKELRNLLSYEDDTIDVMTLIMVGEPRLGQILSTKEELHSLHDRITNSCEFSGLRQDEIKSFVVHKIMFAGGTDVLVDEAVYPLLTEFSDGSSRRIVKIMTKAMAYSAQLGRNAIDAEAAKYAIDHLPGF